MKVWEYDLVSANGHVCFGFVGNLYALWNRRGVRLCIWHVAIGVHLKIINLTQGTPEWHKWRQSGVGASDTPALFDKSPYKSKYQVWADKLGISYPCDDDTENKEWLFERGHKTEALIRQSFEKETGIEMKPVCGQSDVTPFMIASFDGYHQGKGILECKLVGKARLAEIEKGKIPEDHLLQVHHQLIVAGEQTGYYYAHNGEDAGAVVVVKSTKDMRYRILEATEAFWAMVETKTPPALGELDYFIPSDDETKQRFRELAILKEAMDQINENFRLLKNELANTLPHSRAYFENLYLSKVSKTGAIDYKSIPAVKKMSQKSLEKYRKAGSSYWDCRLKIKG